MNDHPEAFNLLDHGFVRLVGHYGSDATIVQAARVSYGAGTKTQREDAKLINYLMRHAHSSPFEQVNFTFMMKLPIFVARQMVRHRTARLNEYSMRYSEAPEDYYLPILNRVQGQGKVNKQGSDGALSDSVRHEAIDVIKTSCNSAHHEYKYLLDLGVSRELARIVLPVNWYTEWYWQMDLSNLFKFLTLRLDAHAQWEVQEYARAIEQIIAPLVPMAYEAWTKHLAKWQAFMKADD